MLQYLLGSWLLYLDVIGGLSQGALSWQMFFLSLAVHAIYANSYCYFPDFRLLTGMMGQCKLLAWIMYKQPSIQTAFVFPAYVTQDNTVVNAATSSKDCRSFRAHS